ncbi:hypothetical protein KY284_036248 [Solanum tuberosum]|nr:hypothetical protein KY284_036248 [Solanum tuberosum]
MTAFTPVSTPPLRSFKIRLTRSYVTLSGMWIPLSVSRYFPSNQTYTLLTYVRSGTACGDQYILTVGSCSFSNRRRFSECWNDFVVDAGLVVTPRAYTLDVAGTREPLLAPSKPLVWLTYSAED